MPPAGTTIVRIGEDCLWDRAFAAPAIDPNTPQRSHDRRAGRGRRTRARRPTRSSAPTASCARRWRRSMPVSGARTGYQVYPGVGRDRLLRSGPAEARSRACGRRSTAITVSARSRRPRSTLTTSGTVLADESLGRPHLACAATTLFRARPAPTYLARSLRPGDAGGRRRMDAAGGAGAGRSRGRRHARVPRRRHRERPDGAATRGAAAGDRCASTPPGRRRSCRSARPIRRARRTCRC